MCAIEPVVVNGAGWTGMRDLDDLLHLGSVRMNPGPLHVGEEDLRSQRHTEQDCEALESRITAQFLSCAGQPVHSIIELENAGKWRLNFQH